jgi:hypothetical protein
MLSPRIRRLALSLSALICMSVSAQTKPHFTSPLPTGVRLDPAGEAVELGSLPINLLLTPEKDKAVVVLSGWREQGIQVVDLRTQKVTQTQLQDGAFYGAAFSPDGHRLCVSGGNTDMLFVYASLPSRTRSTWPRQKPQTARAQAIRRDWHSRPTENSFMSLKMSAIGSRW